jgi:hypothetical protein
MSKPSYINKTSEQHPYQTWKGEKPYSNPIGTYSGHVRPLTNKDYTHSVPYKAGLARPIKHYRRGSVPANYYSSVPAYDGRTVRSSGRNIQLVGDMQEKISGYTITDTPQDCCNDFTVISAWQHTPDNTIVPKASGENCLMCCNAEKNARDRVRGVTGVHSKKNYFNNKKDLMYNRCQTYNQRSFQFRRGSNGLFVGQCKPDMSLLYEREGMMLALAILNKLLENKWIDADTLTMIQTTSTTMQEFMSNIRSLNLNQDQLEVLEAVKCQFVSRLDMGKVFAADVNRKNCAQVYYKPSNAQFATQGGVSSSSQIARVKAMATNLEYRTNVTGAISGNPANEFIYKNKALPGYVSKQKCSSLCFVSDPVV